ncbi:UV excision repair protein RAD23 homolog [Macrobrachium rosenbergii]|uniref:UV excision repair protein RAD23 homolog n=1 Tax=Macrobrachium rosenbergii TaxID=79674 RepID=UPI0034D737F1
MLAPSTINPPPTNPQPSVPSLNHPLTLPQHFLNPPPTLLNYPQPSLNIPSTLPQPSLNHPSTPLPHTTSSGFSSNPFLKTPPTHPKYTDKTGCQRLLRYTPHRLYDLQPTTCNLQQAKALVKGAITTDHFTKEEEEEEEEEEKEEEEERRRRRRRN